MKARIALLLVALAAFSAQQWVAHTHFHLALPAGHAAFNAPQPAGPGHTAGHDCLLCQVASHAAAAAPPPPLPQLVATELHLHLLLPPDHGGDFRAPAGHAWLGRGPPEA